MNKPNATLLCLSTGEACESLAHCLAAGRCSLLEDKSKLPDDVQAAFDETEETHREEDVTKQTRVPAAAPTVDDVIAIVDSLSSADRAKLLKALRALYGDP